MHRKNKVLFLIAAVIFCSVITLCTINAEVSIANIFRNNGVIQHGRPVPVWGLGDPGEKVKITLNGITGCKLSQSHEAIADKFGKWVVTIDPLKAGDKFHLSVQGKDSKDISGNMQAGDVWFYAGYYRFRYKRLIPQITDKAWKEENNDLFPLLRIYGTSEKNPVPQRRENGRWNVPDADNVFGFNPGIANHFAIELCRDKKIPVGIVHAASFQEHWVDEYLAAEDFVEDPALGKSEEAKKLAYRVGGTDECRKMNAERIAYMEKYLEESVKRNAENKTVLNPDFPQYPKWAETKISLLYNGAVYPMLPLAVKGVIYNDPNGQNPFDAQNHGAKLELLVKSFRKWFNDSELPVVIVQCQARSDQNTIRFNTRFAAMQKLAQDDKNVEIAVTNDIEVFDKPDELFLKTIPATGQRVYSLVERKVYGNKSVKSETPQITGFTIENGKIIITFSTPLQTLDGLAPDGFAIKAKGQNMFRPANAEIKGNAIILSAPGMDAPEHVNYCYVNAAIKKSPNVIGENKMPVPAFSTELLTQNGDK